MMASDLKDLYDQKDIHNQIMGKANWVSENRAIIAAEFQRRKIMAIPLDFVLKAVMVTMHPSPLRAVETEFEVMTIGEFDELLPQLLRAYRPT